MAEKNKLVGGIVSPQAYKAYHAKMKEVEAYAESKGYKNFRKGFIFEVLLSKEVLEKIDLEDFCLK